MRGRALEGIAGFRAGCTLDRSQLPHPLQQASVGLPQTDRDPWPYHLLPCHAQEVGRPQSLVGRWEEK